ncbi:hypothetical protein DY240_29840 [Jiangella rhizosphaerae]|uniref:Uncharacterized protein n=1 Tax=Jiangella rhizosphaerae TaxID=2293569 RepID=A0A418KGI2_9ACTN|nr:hypothetical protein DY240_29840 [Jiangella rhizosphaerae]
MVSVNRIPWLVLDKYFVLLKAEKLAQVRQHAALILLQFEVQYHAKVPWPIGKRAFRICAEASAVRSR